LGLVVDYCVGVGLGVGNYVIATPMNIGGSNPTVLPYSVEM